MARLSRQLAAGVLQPLPQVVHALSAVQAALRQMSQARHVGKIVVSAPASEASKAPAGATVVVTGGLGTLGSLTAAWVAQKSSLRVLATGRTGRFAADAASPGSNPLAVLVAACFSSVLSMASVDAAAAADAALLLTCGDGCNAGSAVHTPLAGILHASGVLADATLRNQTLGGLRTTWAPKVTALRQLGSGYNRHPGAFQLLFSSVAALLGSPGQANYSAANAALDAMSQAIQAEASSHSCPASSPLFQFHGHALLSSPLVPVSDLPVLGLGAGPGQQQRAVGRLGWRRHGGQRCLHPGPCGADWPGPGGGGCRPGCTGGTAPPGRRPCAGSRRAHPLA
jgi:NAD(P)-dependent dehydrogenase (short-subunit alcohol dehydrogenase family)